MRTRFRLFIMNGFTPAQAAWYAVRGIFRVATVRRFATMWLA